MKQYITHETLITFAEKFAGGLFTCVIYCAVAFALIKVINFLIKKMFARIIESNESFEFKKQAATVKNLIKSATDALIIVVVGLALLAKFNIDIRPLLAAAGVVGVAVGFASRRFVEDIIMGLFILIEGQIRVGDVVTIDSHTGTVEKITLKMIILRNMQGHVHYIRNGIINVITNQTREYAFPLIDIGVSYDADLDKVTEVIRSVASELRQDEKFSPYILDDVEILGLEKFADSSVIIRLRIRTKAQHQWFIGREINRRIKIAFKKEGISIPFPQRDLHIKKGE